jgi:alpha-tubulin suppressor-like RCC1 family protein
MSQTAYIWFPVARVSTAELNNGTQCRDRDHPVRLQLDHQVVTCSAGSRRCVLATSDGQLLHFGIRFGRSYDQNEAWLPKMLVPADIQYVPRNIVSSRIRMRQVACGDAHCLAVDVRDRLWVCGSNIHGQLGNPALLDSQAEFQQIRLESNDVADDPNEQNPSHFVYISDEEDGNLVDADSNNAQPSQNTRVFHVAAGSSHSAAIAGSQRD